MRLWQNPAAADEAGAAGRALVLECTRTSTLAPAGKHTLALSAMAAASREMRWNGRNRLSSASFAV
jgi:hypothetical protein